MDKRYKKYLKEEGVNKTTLFFLRVFISSLLLLLLVLINTKFNYNLDFFTKHLNFTKISNSVVSLFNDSKIKLENVNAELNYLECFYEKGVNEYHSENNIVNALESGTVIKITKENNLYSVILQTSDDFLFEYSNLENIDVYLYEYIDVGKIIGSATIINNHYVYRIKVCKDDICYEYR